MNEDRTSHFQLIGRRELGVVTVQDYTNWAVAELVIGQDSPSLRILAGIEPNENLWTAEAYFAKAMRELCIPEISKEEGLYRYADLLAIQLARKEGDTIERVRHIYRACVKLDYPKVMSRWVSLDDAIGSVMGGYEPYYSKRLTRENVADVAAEEAQEYLNERVNT
jgi:hypothetical protein